MKFGLWKTNKGTRTFDSKLDTIEINTLEELLEFVKKADDEVIIGFYESDPIEFVLEIYDDYRE